MGEKNCSTISPEFDKSIKIDFTGETVTSDAGALMLVEFESRMGIIRTIASRLADPRNPVFTVYSMHSLLCQRLFGICAGYEDGNDADDLRHDPALRAASGRRKDDEVLASQPSISRLENTLLRFGKNLDIIKVSHLDIAVQYYKMRGAKHIWLDIDSYESPVHGDQQEAAYNAYYGSDCYPPLVLHDGFGLKLKVQLRSGNEYTSTGAAAFLEPVFERLIAEGFKVHLTADSGFADPDTYELCERFQVIYYIRLKSNAALQRKTAHLLTRPPGRPPKGPLVRYAGFHYKAACWSCYRRVVAKATHNPGQLFAEVYCLVTNSAAANKQTFKRYGRRRGRAEQKNDEGKNMMFSTRLSCSDAAANDARLQLYTLAYNFLHIFRLLALAGERKKWTLESVRLRLLKIGARVIKKSRYRRFLLAAGPHLQRLVSNIFMRIGHLPQPNW